MKYKIEFIPNDSHLPQSEMEDTIKKHGKWQISTYWGITVITEDKGEEEE